ncbi:hypothetical protein ACNKHO_12380 [Shigella flexneri]
MTFIPAILLMMTSFTRIIIVFGLLRNASAPHRAAQSGFTWIGAVFDLFHYVAGYRQDLHRGLPAVQRR